MTDTHLWDGARRFQPASKPTSAVLLLHGLGSNADDLIELAPLLAGQLPQTVFISPNAPFACDMAPFGRQWFSLIDRTPFNMWQGACSAAPYVERMTADIRAEFELPLSRIALVGFSQGAMMSLHVAPRLPEPVAGVVGLSGALVGGEHLPADITSRPPVLLVHGQMDPVVPYAALPMAAATLTTCGIAVETETRPFLGHNVDDEGINRTASFLAARLA